MTNKSDRMEGWLRIRIDPELTGRIQRVADDRFGTNKSLLIRRAVEEFITPIEEQILEREESAVAEAEVA